MTTLSKAPLMEAWFELRWGRKAQEQPSKNELQFEFHSEDTAFFPGQFREVAFKRGFSCVERVNPDSIPVPHIITYRFRRKENAWPCYQIGLGIFTVNQVNDGYKWEKFKEDVREGLDVLNQGHPLGLEKLDRLGIQLQYRDAFVFKEGEMPLDFLSKNFSIGFVPPEDFLNFEPIHDEITGVKIAFNLTVKKPVASLILAIQQATINGQPGFLMDTIVRSMDEDTPFDLPSICHWLEDAHLIQRHAFKTLIHPAYARTFK